MARCEGGRGPGAHGVWAACAPGSGLRTARRREGGQHLSGDRRDEGCLAPNVPCLVTKGRPVSPSRRLAVPPSAVLRLGAIAALALAGAGCTALDNGLAKIPFLSFMQASPAYSPYEMTRPAPPGSIPYQSPAGEVYPGLQPNEPSLQAFAASHANPVPMSDVAGLKAGQALFERYCYVCHGPTGKGDGPILNNPASKDPAQQSGKFPFAPNLMLPLTVARADGYIFALMTVGRGLMPEYGSKIPAPERWYVINYLRTLQRAAGATVTGPAAASAPATPGAAPAAAPAAPAAPSR